MVDMSEVDNIMKALDNGWVATFLRELHLLLHRDEEERPNW
jgi:hypothetical protein